MGKGGEASTAGDGVHAEGETWATKEKCEKGTTCDEWEGNRDMTMPFPNIRGTNGGKEESSCHTEQDLGDGDIIPMLAEELGRGTHGGMGDLCHRGVHRPKRRKSGFLKKRRISFEKTWARLRKGSKN
jgi:hypothetical protein